MPLVIIKKILHRNLHKILEEAIISNTMLFCPFVCFDTLTAKKHLKLETHLRVAPASTQSAATRQAGLMCF